jgi:hypothetical protein
MSPPAKTTGGSFWAEDVSDGPTLLIAVSGGIRLLVGKIAGSFLHLVFINIAVRNKKKVVAVKNLVCFIKK